MKAKYWMWMYSLSAVLLMSSCLSDEDEPTGLKELTPAEKQAAIQNAQGTYSGKIFFYNPISESTEQTDSMEINWRVTESDSVFYTNEFPLSIFANYMEDMDVKNILQAAGKAEFQTTIHPYMKENLEKYTYYIFSMERNNSISATMEYAGNVHVIAVKFANSVVFYDSNGNPNTYSPFVESWQSKQAVRLYLESITVDGKTTDVINSVKRKSIVLTGNK